MGWYRNVCECIGMFMYRTVHGYMRLYEDLWGYIGMFGCMWDCRGKCRDVLGCVELYWDV